MFFAYHTPANLRFAGQQYQSATFYLSQDQRQATEEKTKVLGAYQILGLKRIVQYKIALVLLK